MVVDSKENIVRILFPNKVLNGRVLGGAFVLRPQRQETNMSVFRTIGVTFISDISKLDAGRNLQCSVMRVAEVRDVNISQKLNTLSCEVVATGDLSITSHAGIIVLINGQQLIGGRESEIMLESTDGSIDTLVLAMQHRLASIAQKGITRVNSVIESI